MSNTGVLEKPDTRTGSDDGSGNDDPEVFHYVRHDKIVESAVEGTHVVALCGEVFPVTKTPKPGSPVCEPCKKIYDQMRKD